MGGCGCIGLLVIILLCYAIFGYGIIIPLSLLAPPDPGIADQGTAPPQIPIETLLTVGVVGLVVVTLAALSPLRIIVWPLIRLFYMLILVPVFDIIKSLLSGGNESKVPRSRSSKQPRTPINYISNPSTQKQNEKQSAPKIEYDGEPDLPLEPWYPEAWLIGGVGLKPLINTVSKATKGFVASVLTRYYARQWTSLGNLKIHFKRHGHQFAKHTKKRDYDEVDYARDASRLRQTGTKVTFESGKYAGTTNYIRFAGHYKDGGKSKGFVELLAVNKEGKIITYTFKTISQLNKWGMRQIP